MQAGQPIPTADSTTRKGKDANAGPVFCDEDAHHLRWAGKLRSNTVFVKPRWRNPISQLACDVVEAVKRSHVPAPNAKSQTQAHSPPPVLLSSVVFPDPIPSTVTRLTISLRKPDCRCCWDQEVSHKVS
jgi:hypothetical protein